MLEHQQFLVVDPGQSRDQRLKTRLQPPPRAFRPALAPSGRMGCNLHTPMTDSCTPQNDRRGPVTSLLSDRAQSRPRKRGNLTLPPSVSPGLSGCESGLGFDDAAASLESSACGIRCVPCGDGRDTGVSHAGPRECFDPIKQSRSIRIVRLAPYRCGVGEPETVDSCRSHARSRSARPASPGCRRSRMRTVVDPCHRREFAVRPVDRSGEPGRSDKFSALV